MTTDFPKTHSPVWAPDIFKDKVVFCTGGAGTICSVQVAALVQLGANATILGRRAAHTAEVAAKIALVRPGAKVLGLSVDVRSPPSLADAVAKTLEAFGRIDYVICGAAGNFLASIDQLSENAFKSVMDIDVLGSYNTVKACLPALKASKGRVIFVSATLHYTGSPFQAHVSAAKAAVDALSQVLAVEMGPWGITSNVCFPPKPNPLLPTYGGYFPTSKYADGDRSSRRVPSRVPRGCCGSPTSVKQKP